MAFAHLLLFACLIQLNQLDPERITKIRDRRIVESDMTILTNTQTAKVDRGRLE